jgi:hypothetical protein
MITQKTNKSYSYSLPMAFVDIAFLMSLIALPVLIIDVLFGTIPSDTLLFMMTLMIVDLVLGFTCYLFGPKKALKKSLLMV